MAQMLSGNSPREDVSDRFRIAQDRTDVNLPGSLELQQDIRQIYTQLADFVNNSIEDCREKSLAITHLEESMMWFGKALFKPRPMTDSASVSIPRET